MISGTASVDSAELDSIWTVDNVTPEEAISIGSTYCLEGQDSTGTALASSCFDLDVTDSQDDSGFTRLIEYGPSITSIILRKGDQILATVTASDNVPSVNITAPITSETWTSSSIHTITWTGSDADGDSLTYHVLYSYDGGTSWFSLGETTDTQVTVNADDLPGTDNGIIKVMATDGFHTVTTLTSTPFSVAKKAPSVGIISPEDTITVSANSPFVVEGYGNDLEDGSLFDASLVWTSDKDGIVGTGEQALITLTTLGLHTLTLGAIDSDGQVATTSLNVNVVDQCYYLWIATAPEDYTTAAIQADPAPNCDGERYLPGTTVTLTALSTGAMEFSYWGDDASGSNPTISLTLNSDKLVTANFADFCSSVTDVPVSECEALMTVYHTTDGDNWLNHDGWGTSTEVCTWYGIRCVGWMDTPPGSGNVEEVDLANNGLKGAFPLAFANLPSLHLINVSTNQLTGTLPAELGALLSLETLNVSDNQISGNLPADLQALTSLQVLDVSGNQLSGTIPTELSVLNQLLVLNLARNRFEGEVPSAISALSQLQTVDLSYNAFTDAGPLSQLDSDWLDTQTITPTGLSVSNLRATSTRINWTAIPYTGDGGYYELTCSDAPDGIYFETFITDSKNVESYSLQNLSPSTKYACVMRTFTPTHGSYESSTLQQNALWSEYSELLEFTTPALITTELMINPSAEQLVPNAWDGLDTTTSDQPDCALAYIDNCSYKLVGENELNKRLIFVKNIAGNAGDTLNLSFWNRTLNATGAYQAKIVIIHSDFATTASKQEITVNLTGGTHGWQQAMAQITATKTFSQLRVLLVYRGSSGSVWFDNVSFTQNGTQLMINQSMEAAVPNGWEGLDTTLIDHPDCGLAYMDSCSYNLVGENELNKRLIFVKNIAGNAGDTLNLSFWNRTLNATGAYQGKIVIIHSDFATTGSKEEVTINLMGGTHDWQQATTQITATKAFSQLRVLLVYRGSSGSVWFDNFSFILQH